MRDTATRLTKVENIVDYCIDTNTDALAVNQKLETVLADASKVISVESLEKAQRTLKDLRIISRGLIHHVSNTLDFRSFYFGQFVAGVKKLESEMEQRQIEESITCAENQPYFVDIMKILYEFAGCKYDAICDTIDADKETLSNTLTYLLDCGIAVIQWLDEYKFYCLTPLGRRYCKNHLKLD